MSGSVTVSKNAVARFAKVLGCVVIATHLAGCIPAALVVGATAGGAIVYDKRSTKTMIHDQQAGESLTQMTSNTPELQKGTHIVVATFHRVMLIAGQTETPEQRDKVYQLATTIPNVSRIYNEITVGTPISEWQRTKDSWITTKIKSKMLGQVGFHSTEIKVVTENGVVYLMGVLSRSQADDAVDIARRVDGVRTVVKVFEYPQ